ncbi:MAG: hypothetical protein C0472_14535 [Erythrobacter sp.]|nr:hypothetical protein [Erythrobacter sp.]MBA4172364.1 hypothetical protein [Hyphomicrobium sp.]
MSSKIPRSFEYFLISNDFLAVWLLPVLALVCGGGALYGSGIFGDPVMPENVLTESYMKPVPPALKNADGAAYEGWAGTPRDMSGFIVGQINENLRMADTDTTFEGKPFEDALSLTVIGEAAAPATPSANKAQGITAPSKQAPANAEATVLQKSQDALGRWAKRYWCARQGWDANWSQNIVRPLVARGVGGCSTAERFAAQSPIAAALGLGLGIFILVVLCVLAAVCGYAFFIQIRVREAYQLAYKSNVMGE